MKSKIELTKSEIFGNPYNFSLKEMVACMGEEEATNYFKSLYRNKPKMENQTVKIKEVFNGNDTSKYAFELSDGYCIETVCIKKNRDNCLRQYYGWMPSGVYFLCVGKEWVYTKFI